jgi:hypothetical protein
MSRPLFCRTRAFEPGSNAPRLTPPEYHHQHDDGNDPVAEAAASNVTQPKT